MELVWDILNQPFVIAALAALLIWGLNKLYTAKPTWQKYVGAVIEAVKWAEKAVPDDSDNKAVARLNAALQYAVRVIAEAEGRGLSDREKAELADGIRQVHADLEANGNLEK